MASSSDESEGEETQSPTLETFNLLTKTRQLLSGASQSEQYRKLHPNATEGDVLTQKLVTRGKRPISNKAMVLKEFNQKMATTRGETDFNIQRMFFFENLPVDDLNTQYEAVTIQKQVFSNTGFKLKDFKKDESLKELKKTLSTIVDSEGKNIPRLDPIRTLATTYCNLVSLQAQELLKCVTEEAQDMTKNLVPSVKATLVAQFPETPQLRTLNLAEHQLALRAFEELVGKITYLTMTTNELLQQAFDPHGSSRKLLEKIREHQILYPMSDKTQTWKKPAERHQGKKTVKIIRSPNRDRFKYFSNKKSFSNETSNSYRGDRDRRRKTRKQRSRERSRRKSTRETKRRETSRRATTSRSRSRFHSDRSRSRSQHTERSRTRSRRRSRTTEREKVHRSRSRSQPSQKKQSEENKSGGARSKNE